MKTLKIAVNAIYLINNFTYFLARPAYSLCALAYNRVYLIRRAQPTVASFDAKIKKVEYKASINISTFIDL